MRPGFEYQRTLRVHCTIYSGRVTILKIQEGNESIGKVKVAWR
jgi:hypothetical protein